MRRDTTFPMLLATTALVGSAFAFSAGPSLAACSTNTPTEGETVNCSAPLDNEGIQAGNAANVTVEIPDQSSAGISVTNQMGILLGNGADISILGAGAVRTAGNDSVGISAGNNSSVEVTGTVATTGNRSGAIRLGDNATVIVGPGPNSEALVRTGGQNANAIDVGANSSITINGNSRIATSNSQSNAIDSAGQNVNLDIAQGAVVTTSSGNSNPVNLTGSDAVVTIAGDVTSSAGNANAVNVTGDNAQITIEDSGFVNASSSGSNLIEATGEGSTVTVNDGTRRLSASSGNVTAINLGRNGTANINREIAATSSNATAIAATSGTTINLNQTGSLVASSSQSVALRFNSSRQGTNTVNLAEGAFIDARGGQAIVATGPASESITASGSIRGQNGAPVIELGGGDDDLEVTRTGSLTAPGSNTLVDGGSGTDRVALRNDAAYNSARFLNIETLIAGGMGTRINTMGSQPQLGLRAEQGGTVNVQSGSTVQSTTTTGNSTTNIRGTVQGSVRTGGGGTTGSMATIAAAASSGPTTNIGDGGVANNVVTAGGGTTNVNAGGTANNVSTSSGGTTNVRDGGTANNVSTSEGGTTVVNAGGTANLAEGQGSGGTQRFEAGSNVGTNAGAGGDAQSRPGTSFAPGTNVRVNNSAFFVGSASRDTISFTLPENAFASRAVTANQRGVGRALDNGSDELIRRVVLTGEAGVPELYSTLNGPVYAQTYGGIGLAGRSFSASLREQADIGAAASEASQAIPALSYAGSFAIAEGASERTFNADIVEPYDEPVVVQPSPTGYAFIGGFGNHTEIDGDLSAFGSTAQTYGGFAGYELQTGGFLAGLVPFLDIARAGIAGGYSQTDLDIDGVAQSATSDNYQVGLYTASRFGRIDIASAISYGYHDIETDRSILAAGIPSFANASFDAHSISTSTEFSLDVVADDRFGLSPFVAYESSSVFSESFTETGAGVLNLRVDDDFRYFGWASIGAKADTELDLGAASVALEVRASYEYAFNDDGFSQQVSLAGSPLPFTANGTGGEKSRFSTGLSASTAISEQATVSARYDGRFAEDLQDHSFSARVGIAF